MPKHYFDVGDSSRGPIGFCAMIKAKNKMAAVKRLKNLVPEYVEIKNDELKGDEFIRVYFGWDQFTAHDIDSVED